jgi:hypothetical protein
MEERDKYSTTYKKKENEEFFGNIRSQDEN